MSGKPSGRRIENFSSADIVAHGREARRKAATDLDEPFPERTGCPLEEGLASAPGSGGSVGPPRG